MCNKMELKLELYKEINNIFGVETKTKTDKFGGAHFSVNICNKNSIRLYFLKMLGEADFILNTNVYGGTRTAKWVLLVRFVMFTSTHVYSFVWNQ